MELSTSPNPKTMGNVDKAGATSGDIATAAVIAGITNLITTKCFGDFAPGKHKRKNKIASNVSPHQFESLTGMFVSDPDGKRVMNKPLETKRNPVTYGRTKMNGCSLEVGIQRRTTKFNSTTPNTIDIKMIRVSL